MHTCKTYAVRVLSEAVAYQQLNNTHADYFVYDNEKVYLDNEKVYVPKSRKVKISK